MGEPSSPHRPGSEPGIQPAASGPHRRAGRVRSASAPEGLAAELPSWVRVPGRWRHCRRASQDLIAEQHHQGPGEPTHLERHGAAHCGHLDSSSVPLTVPALDSPRPWIIAPRAYRLVSKPPVRAEGVARCGCRARCARRGDAHRPSAGPILVARRPSPARTARKVSRCPLSRIGRSMPPCRALEAGRATRIASGPTQLTSAAHEPRPPI